MNRTTEVKLEAQPLRFSISERKSFKISIAAINHGSEVVDPELSRAELFINGQKSRVWRLAITNGRREAAWSALPPGETTSMTWSTMGMSLFPEPGEFELRLRHGDTELDPIQVEVIAE